MLRRTRARLAGLLQLHVGTGTLLFDGVHVVPMVAANHVFHDPVELRRMLDADGYVYLKNLVPREATRAAYVDVCRQLEKNAWWSKAAEDALVARDGFMYGAASPAPIVLPSGELVPAALPAPVTPFHVTEKVARACYGPTILSAVRHLFGGGAECMNYNSLDLAAVGERTGFSMPAVYMNQGTKLVLTAWVALHDMPLSVGGLVCSKGSNSSDAFIRVRNTYGMHDVETAGIAGDGTLTSDPGDVWNLGDGACPLATSSFEPGDVVFTTVYTMQAFATNRSHQWRVSAQSRWVMHGDDVGCDPRFKSGDAQAPQLNRWFANRGDATLYPRSMAQARAEWGIAAVEPPAQLGANTSSAKA
jgi:hypothetical protein